MTIEEAKTFLNNLKVCIEEHPIVADWLVEIADRKTENCSENPNNSDTISRQAAISAICNACGKIDCDKMNKCEKLQLPPANCSEFPNNCEHITEDGVTCAKYPACDDCLDNPLNKVKGSERLVKGSEQTDCQTCKWGEWYRQGYDITMMDDECGGCCSWNSKWTPKTEPTISKMEQVDKDINVRSKDEPQTEPLQTCSVNGRPYDCGNCEYHKCTADEPQTERSE